MSNKEIIELHERVLQTPTYLMELKLWQLKELLAYSNLKESQYDNHIQMMKDQIDQPEFKSFFDDGVVADDMRRERKLQKHIKICIDALKEKGEIAPEQLADIPTMFGVPVRDWYKGQRRARVALEIRNSSHSGSFTEKRSQSSHQQKNINRLKFEESLKSTTNEFFELVNSGQLSKLDIHNKIQGLTDDYDEDKLNLLCEEFDSYISEKYENWRASYTQDDIDKRIAKYHDKGIELPTRFDEKYKYKWLYVRKFFWRTRWGKPISDEEHEKDLKELFGDDHIPDSKVIDMNVLLGGFYYKPENFNIKTKSFPLIQLRDILIDLKRKHTSSVYRFDDKPKDLEINSNYINWLESDESRKQFIEALQEHNLIEARDTEAIIKDHFKPVREQNSKPEPIEWQETIALLAYMIESLDQQYIKPVNIWKDTAPHFSVKGHIPKNLRQTSNRFKQNKSGKPKNYKIVDRVIDSLSD